MFISTSYFICKHSAELLVIQVFQVQIESLLISYMTLKERKFVCFYIDSHVNSDFYLESFIHLLHEIL